MVGFWVDKYPEMVKAIDQAGFEIGTHSNTHPDMAKISQENIAKELDISTEKIKAITGKEVTLSDRLTALITTSLFRPAIKEILFQFNGMLIRLTGRACLPPRLPKGFVTKVESGSIILMHNNADNVVDALKMVLERLTNDGYQITSVGQLVYHSNYTIDRNGVQHSN